MMRILDLFSGIGGFSLGLERTGAFRTVAFCEIDPFCRRVLAKHWPGVPIISDVTTAEFPDADIIVGGFPCQDISGAGKRAGLSGARSGLYRELVRAIRLVRPRHAIVENVADLLGNGMGTVLGDLAESGCDAEWDCVPAESLGAPHERERVFIVAHAQSADDGDDHADPTERQEPKPGSGACSVAVADPPRVGCGPGRSRRPPDSFAWIRDEARRNAADPYGARLAFRESIERDAHQELASFERGAERDVVQSIWPREPALLGVDDGVSERVDRVRALGNTLLPQIPEMIGRAILAAERGL